VSCPMMLLASLHAAGLRKSRDRAR
jgi:hypothetical protein